jgi:hypothetical protein
MTHAAAEERAVVLGDWPQPAAGAPRPRLLADDCSLSLLFRTADDRFAVVRFPLCIFLAFGAPNDEALAGHPLYQCGLRHYSIHEILGSSLVRELERRNSVHPRHDPDWYLQGTRHYVFTFQDSTLECVVDVEKWWAPSIELFEREEEAEQSWRSVSAP